MRAANEDFVANTISISQTGKDIQTNAVNLGHDLTTQMNNFEQETMLLVVPSCIQNVLQPYITTHKAELDKMVQKRQTIGNLLAKASDLISFNEQMIKSGFNRISDNMDGTNPANIQRVSNFNPNLK